MYRRGNPQPVNPTVEIIPNRFVFSIIRVPPQNTNQVFYFTIDNDEQFIYQPFFADFGPLSLLQIQIFLIIALNHLSDHPNQLVTFYCSQNGQQISNAVLLAVAFRLIHLGLNSDEAYQPFHHLYGRCKPYRDASSFPSTYDLTVISCIKGLERAMNLGWYDPDNFDAEKWSIREQVENGDMNWLIPNKLLAFASPYNTNEVQGYRVCMPGDVVPTFKELGITRIIRLNNKTYDENVFKEANFIHTELFFPDGTNPPPNILQDFLDIIEGPDIVALHCKAGLGRTGTLAGCYMIKNYNFSAPEAIGWIRLCRPGSIIGPQQHFLIHYDSVIHRPPLSASSSSTPHPRPKVTKSTKKPSLSRPSDIRSRHPTPSISNCSSHSTASKKSRDDHGRIGTSNYYMRQGQPSHSPKPREVSHLTPMDSRPKTTVTKTVAPPSTRIPRNKSRDTGLSVVTGENLLQIQAVALTPQVPQPRKLQRAMNSRKSSKK